MYKEYKVNGYNTETRESNVTFYVEVTSFCVMFFALKSHDLRRSCFFLYYVRYAMWSLLVIYYVRIKPRSHSIQNLFTT